jgi:RNA polymerase sigma-70 factor (ECF subfamily)
MNDGPHDLSGWFEAHSGALALYARQWLDDHAAVDAVQEAFLSLLSQKRRPLDVRAWLFRTVRNAALNELRRRRTRAEHARDVAAARPAWFQPDLADGLDAQAAQEALSQLPPEQSELIVMRIWGQMTYEQMAEVAGESLSTVHGRYAAAIESLRRKMVTHGNPQPKEQRPVRL